MSMLSCQPCQDVRLCKSWARGNVCGQRNCPFRHHTISEQERRRVRKATQQRELALAANRHPDDPYLGDDTLTHGGRFVAFARWLVDTFGTAQLRSGAGVIDVAGGRGALAFELHCRMGICSTVVEPRSITLKGNQRRHIRKHPERGCYTHVQAALDDHFASTARGIALLSHCSALVGLHSDEATEALVEAALRFGKPFAVVPCCVFAERFSARSLADGTPVRTYEQFCEWLRLRAPGARIGFLPFAGRNRVIFRTAATEAAPKHIQALGEPLRPLQLKLHLRAACSPDSGLGVELHMRIYSPAAPEDGEAHRATHQLGQRGASLRNRGDG